MCLFVIHVMYATVCLLKASFVITIVPVWTFDTDENSDLDPWMQTLSTPVLQALAWATGLHLDFEMCSAHFYLNHNPLKYFRLYHDYCFSKFYKGEVKTCGSPEVKNTFKHLAFNILSVIYILGGEIKTLVTPSVHMLYCSLDRFQWLVHSLEQLQHSSPVCCRLQL